MSVFKPALFALPLSVLIAAPALAHSDVKNPVVMDRMMTMKAIQGSMKTLGDMAKGKIPFDAEKATAAAAAMAHDGKKVPEKFRAHETDPKSEALPAIWTISTISCRNPKQWSLPPPVSERLAMSLPLARRWERLAGRARPATATIANRPGAAGFHPLGDRQEHQTRLIKPSSSIEMFSRSGR